MISRLPCRAAGSPYGGRLCPFRATRTEKWATGKLQPAAEKEFTLERMPSRAVTWNLYNGGLDNNGQDDRRFQTQGEILADLAPDVLCLPEATWWHEDGDKRLDQMAERLGMRPVAMVRSRLGTPPNPNNTALLYRPTVLELVDWRHLGADIFHHALIYAHLRPRGTSDDSRDFFVLATHLSWRHGDARLDEVRGWMTDYAGDFAGIPSRGMLIGDLNVPDRRPPSWTFVPPHLHARYRQVLPDGAFGDVDQRALRVLIESGWQDPQTLTGQRRAPTVGYYYPNEPVYWCLDHALLKGMPASEYFTHDTPEARAASDHLPVVLDTVI